MLLLGVRNSNGFTLIETLVIVSIVGILSAIAAPSFLALLDRAKLNSAVAEVRGALQEAQREAIRKSKPCTVTLNIAERKVTSPCLVTGDRTLPERVAMVTNISAKIIPGNPITGPIQLTFGIWGTAEFTVTSSVTPPDTPTDPSGKIVLYISNTSTSEKKCVAISNTLGLTRAGTYSGLITASNITDSGICTAS